MSDTSRDHNRTHYGLILIGIGVLLLLLQMFGNAGHYIWPLLIIGPGVILVVLAGTGFGPARYQAVAGAVVTGVGTILLVQTVFDYFQSWAYAWALLPFFAGGGFVYASHVENDPGLAETGRSMMRSSAVAFAVLGILFEVLIFNGGLFGGRYVAPVILIVIGGFLMFSRQGLHRPHAAQDQPKPAAPVNDAPPPPAG